jgi:outer membrane receptor for ferrienterochelin and colicins
MNDKTLNIQVRVLIVCLFLIVSLDVYAQQTENSQNLEKVVVQGERKEYSGIRELVAGKIVLGREWLDRSAASTLAEALRRESSVSVGSGGKISLKGLQGYTQVLLDGQAPIGNGDPTQMDPSLIERVEIIHSASADTGAFGLAGTINVVTRNRRKVLPKLFNINGGANGRNDTTSLSLQGGWRELSGTTFNISGEASSSHKVQPGVAVWSWVNRNGSDERIEESTENKSASRDVTVSPSLTWKLSSTDELQIKGSLSASEYGFDVSSISSDGALFENSDIRPYTANLSDANRTNSVSLNSQWRHKLDNEGTWTARINLIQERIEQERNATAVWSSNFVNRLGVIESSIKNYVNSQLQLSIPNREGHKVQFALSSNLFIQNKEQSTQINGINATGDWLGSYQADLLVLDSAAWMQDDWNVSDTLDLKLGLRLENRITRWDSAGMQSKLAANLSAPSLNLAWKLDPDGEQTLTLGLARSFSRVGAAMLSPRPDIAGTSQCATNGKCGANDPNQPDRVGNPKLKYEHSWGFDIALENRFGEESLWSASAYHRWISDTFAWVTQRETVPWATAPRWVHRPTNVGTATAFGLTFGINTQLSDWMGNAPNLGVNANVQWNQSSLSTLPGPDNRLENHQPWSGRLGLTYKLEDKPLELQADLLLNPAQWWQASVDKRIYTGTHKTVSVKGIWIFSPERKLVLTVQNLVPFSDKMLTLFSGEPAMQVATSQRSRTMISFRFESSFD